MAIGIENQSNIIPAGTAGYPNGDIKDRAGSAAGTPVNRSVYADIHQFFAKLLRARNIVANGLPDNETNGHQYFDAFESVFSDSGISDSDFALTLQTSNCTGNISASSYSVIRAGRKVDFTYRFTINITATVSGVNNWFNYTITPSSKYIGMPSSVSMIDQINSNTYSSSNSVPGRVNSSGNIVSRYDNTFSAVAMNSYFFVIKGSYLTA